jgi:Domain of unknown function (DUF4399)
VISRDASRQACAGFLPEGYIVSSTTLASAALSLLICVATCGAAYSQARGGPTPSPAGAAVYFIDLKTGATLPTKSTIHFGLRGMGVAPAGSDRENSGHHHLLVDSELPPLDQPIPNDFNHLHFGAGQTEAEVTLAPGEHTLQLLLGDKSHIPHSPPLMSERIRVRVVETGAGAAPGTARRHPSAANAKVYFVYPTDGAYVSRTPNIRFGLVNMGIAPAGIERANTGHHHLMVDAPLPPLDQPIPNDFNHLHFGAGQTEAQITLPLGEHTLQLLLGDENHLAHEPPVYSKPIKVMVTTTGRRPPVRPPVHKVRR